MVTTTEPADRQGKHPLIPTWAERLNQDEVWWNSQGIPIPLEAMDRAYRLSVLQWIFRHDADIVQTVLYYWLFQPGPRGEQAILSFETALDGMERDPSGYLATTKLVVALADDDLGRVFGAEPGDLPSIDHVLEAEVRPEEVPEPISPSDLIDYLAAMLVRVRDELAYSDDHIVYSAFWTIRDGLGLEPLEVRETAWNLALRRVFGLETERDYPHPEL